MQIIRLSLPRHGTRGSWLLATTLLSPLVVSCTESASGPRVKPLASTDSAGQVMFGVRAPLTDKGKSVGMLRADSGFVYDDGMRLEFRRVTVTLVSPEGTPLSVMTARAASYSLDDSQLDLRASVEITGNNGQRLQTPALTFNVARNRLTSDSAYTLTTANGKATKGTGFVASPSLTRVVTSAEQARLDADSAKAAAALAAREQAAREKAAAAAARAARSVAKPATRPQAAPPASSGPSASAAATGPSAAVVPAAPKTAGTLAPVPGTRKPPTL